MTTPSRRPVYMLVVLLAAYVLAFVDRQLLNLLAEPLKRDLPLSDLQVSLLQGPAFALFLALAGVPIGRLVDARARSAGADPRPARDHRQRQRHGADLQRHPELGR